MPPSPTRCSTTAIASSCWPSRCWPWAASCAASRQLLPPIMINVLLIRDHLLASELDLDLVRSHPEAAPVLVEMHALLGQMADELERRADDLLFFRRSAPLNDWRRALAALNRMPQRLPAQEDRKSVV